MKNALRLLVLVLVGTTAYAESSFYDVRPGKNQRDKVAVADHTFQVSTTNSSAGSVAFHVTIEGVRSVRRDADLSIGLARYSEGKTPDGAEFGKVSAYAGAPAAKVSRNGASMTCDFTISGDLIKAPDLVLSLAYISRRADGTRVPSVDFFFVYLRDFIDATADSRGRNR